MKLYCTLAALLALAACDRTATIAWEDAGRGADGSTPAGDGCTPLCDGRRCGPDGCGGLCGDCPDGLTCDAAAGQCVCEPDSPQRFCARLGKECGPVTHVDNCGQERTENCGECAAPRFCDGSNRCHACVPESPAELCANAGIGCGPLNAVDRCGDAHYIAECGPCGEGETCVGTTCRPCTPQSDAQLCADWFKSCGTPTMADACDIPRAVACGSCADPESCLPNDVCGTAGVPTNDRCAHPERIALDANGAATVEVDLAGASDDLQGGCSAYGADRVYAVVLAAPKIVTVTVAASSGAEPIVYLRRLCEDDGTPGDCAVAQAPGATVRRRYGALAAGVWYLVVDSTSTSSGPVTLDVSAVDPPPVPANDSCASPTRLSFVGDVATASGDFTSAADDSESSCGGGAGPDLVYAFALPAESSVAVRAVSLDPSANAPIVTLRSRCAGGVGEDEVGCAMGQAEAAVRRARLAGGTWYVVVDAPPGAYGPFTLEVALGPPVLNDGCQDPQVITLDAAGTGSVGGDTRFGLDDVQSSCFASSASPDLVYSFVVPANTVKDVDVQLVPASGSLLLPALSVRASCNDPRTERGCVGDASGPSAARLALTRVPAGTWYVLVDGALDAAGPFALQLALTDPAAAPANDGCAGVVPLSIPAATGEVEVLGTTRDAVDDWSAACAPGAAEHTGGDVVYRIDLTRPASIGLEVRPAAATPWFRPALSVRSDCRAAAPDVGCADAPSSGGGAVALALEGLQAGSYYVVVDGLGGTTGDFTLSAVSYEPVTHDDCATAHPLDFDVTGHARARSNTCAADDSAASAGCGGGGADVVYRFTLGDRSDLTARLAPGHAGTSVLSLRRACADATSQRVCSQADGGQPNELRVRDLDAGTWYLWVDGEPGLCGVFDLQVAATPPAPWAANDTCAGAQSIPIDTATGRGSASGDTFDARNDDVGSCAGGYAADLVYAIDLPQAQSLSVELITAVGSALKPVLYLRRSCDDPRAQMACASTGGGSARLDFPRLAAGTWYLFVDGAAAGSDGAFDLQVALGTPPSAPPNDTCGGAIPLSFDSVTGKARATGDTSGATDDFGSHCASSGMLYSGPDVVYSFTLAQAASVTATVTRDLVASPDYLPGLSLRASCAASDEIACFDAGGATATVTETLDAGTYYVVVDGLAGAPPASGAFVLELTRGAARPGDGCGNPLPFVLDASGAATVTGTLSTATASTTGTCAFGSRDVVYSLTLAQDQAVDVSISGGTVYLRRSCVDPTTEVGCSAARNGVALSYPRLGAGTWYLWVDSSWGPGGSTYALTVTTGAPTAAVPNNDTCARIGLLALDPISHGAHASGDTRGANDDFVGSCSSYGYPLSGGDVVYSFTLGQAATVHAILARDASTPAYLPALYLRTSCASAARSDERGCASSSPGTGSAALDRALPAGTYYLVVDGQRGTAGRFNLELVARSTPLGGNDGCGSVEPIALDVNGFGMAVGTTVDASDSPRASCGSTAADGKDVVYSFTTGSTKDIVIEVAPGPDFNPIVYLRGVCFDPASQRACDVQWSGGSAHLSLSKLPAGTWYLWVDSASASSGPFAVTIQASDPPPAATNDSCAGVTELVLDGSGAAHATGDTSAATDGGTASCATAAEPLDGNDLVYQFTLTSAARVEAKVTPATGSTFRPAVCLRAACASAAPADELACARFQNPNATAVASLAAGTWYLVVDGIGGSYGAFALDVTTSAPVAGDTCATAVPLVPDAQGIVTFAGTTTGANDSGDGSCAPGSGKDVVYWFNLSQARDVTLEVEPVASSLAPAVYLRTACADSSAGSEMYCAVSSSGGAMQRRTRLAAGTWYLWIDSSSSWGEGGFSGSLTFAAPVQAPVNDTCAAALALQFSGTTGTATGETWWATDSGSGTCGQGRGPDVVYQFTTSAAQKLTATVARDASASDFRPMIYLRSACAQNDDSAELTCAVASYGTATAVINSLPAGTWYLWVDSVEESAADSPGGFTVTATLDPPVTAAPANESCGTAQTLNFVGNIAGATGTSVDAQNEATASCSYASANAGDVVYRITLAAPQLIRATLTPAPGFDAALSIRDACGSARNGHELACTAALGTSNPLTATVRNAAPGSYWIWIDGNGFSPSTSAGTFSLEVALEPPLVPPSNDTCAAPIALAFGVPQYGDTTAANDDYGPASTPLCGAWQNPAGPDLIYSYVPATSGLFTVELTPLRVGAQPAWDPVLLVMESTCGAATGCLAHGSAGAAGAPESVSIRGTGSVAYYFVVDSSDPSTFGSFSIQVR